MCLNYAHVSTLIAAITVLLTAIYIYENERNMLNLKEEVNRILMSMKINENTHWFPVFMAFSGNGQSVYDAWFDDTSSTDNILTQYLQTGRKKHIRSKLIDSWRNIREIKLELFDENKNVVWIKFKGAGTTNKNWLSKQNLLSSSFNDLTPSTTFNYFSMEGEQRGTNLDRKFFINRQYGGCDNDHGWLVIADKYIACSWENKGSLPVFTYTANYTPRNWIRDGKTADTMVISVLLNV